MSWYQDVAEYIDRDLEGFVEHFFPECKLVKSGKSLKLNPAPCCGHNDCFTFSRHKNGGYCFSCGTKGTRIEILENIKGQEAARRELEKWSGIRYTPKEFTEEEQKAYHFRQRVQEIMDKAVHFYHEQLLKNPEALEKQLGSNQAAGQRCHTIEALKAYRVGLSGNYVDFYKAAHSDGYTIEELKEAGKLIWIPEGYFVYPYYDVRGELIRLNTKMWFRSCQSKKMADGTYAEGSCHFTTFDLSKETKEAHEKETGHKMSADGFSTGEKSLMYMAPGSYRGQKHAILLEGENDVISVWEELQRMPKNYAKDFLPLGIGGKADDDAFRDTFLRQFESLYECFDLDDAGNGYRRELDEKVPDVPVYSVTQHPNLKDIDAFLKSPLNRGEFQEMIDTAKFVDTNHTLIEPEGRSHKWLLKNRKFRLEFSIDSLNGRSGQLEGILLIFKSNTLTDKRTGALDAMKLDASLNPSKLKFSQYLEEHYNDVTMIGDKPKRSFWELLFILPFSRSFHKVIRQLAWYLYNADKTDYEYKVSHLQKRLNQKIVAEIFKEVNGFTNDDLDPHTLFPRMQISQFFHVANNDAYFYFSKLVREGDTAKLVPCLVSNKKEEIRLDLLKRKDPQCLLLVNNRYELPFEVPTAIMDPTEVSLQPYWVDKWKNEELDPADYEPGKLIQEIENFVSSCYYTTKEIVKVLSLWIYATYFYNLFRSGFPYLIFNGPKGSGKSTFDLIIYLLALNPKLTLDTTESALFRMVSFEGGTFILDEVENLAEKKHADASGYAKILKGGYADLGAVYRTNMEKGVVERFSVFSPKVISNINGIDDVIGDRCIYIRTTAAPEEELAKLTDPMKFKGERRAEVHSITSRCVISALIHFRKVSELFDSVDSRLDTGNARLTQIMRPLLTMANLVGGDYAEHLMNYYDKEIRAVKEEIAAGTVEGMISNVLRTVAEELTGLSKDKWATETNKHSYEVPIRYHESTGMFEIDTMHIKVFCEELHTTADLDFKLIDSAMRNVLGAKFNYKENRKRTHVTIDEVGLRKQMKDRKHVRVNRYYLRVTQFVTPERLSIPTMTDTSLF